MTRDDSLTLYTIPVDALTAEQRQAVITLCTLAYGEDFSDFFAACPATTHVLAYRENQLVSHAAWVTRWLQPAGWPELRTAYVEAVATHPDHQGRGYASTVLRHLATQILDFDLCGLSPSDPAFYARLGWELWQGPLAIRQADGLLPTPGERVMILRLPRTPPLDLTAQLTAEWRVGELW
jgi:aminoglycoside 2'-N-acetyltransferase I